MAVGGRKIRQAEFSICQRSEEDGGGGRVFFNNAAPLLEPSRKAGVRSETVCGDLGSSFQRTGEGKLSNDFMSSSAAAVASGCTVAA